MKFLITILLGISLLSCGIFEYPSPPSSNTDSAERIIDPLNQSANSDTIPKSPQDTVNKNNPIPEVIPPKKDTIASPTPMKAPFGIQAKLDEFMRNNAHKYDNNVMVFVHNGDSLIYSYKQGIYTSDDYLPIASSSKWITAAVIMSIVDDKKLNLNDKVGKYLPLYNQYGKGEITIRQLFSHTSGIIPDSPFDDRGSIDLKASVDSIAIYTTLLFPPGKGVIYGSSAYKIAARVAEVIEQKEWRTIFEERIASKCDMKNVVFSPSWPQNPHTGAGAVCSLNQYVKFLSMLHNKGFFKGKRVLSESAIEEMERDQSETLNTLYGLGLWRYQISNGKALEVSSPSAMGVHPWINRSKNYFGLIFTQAGFDKTYDTNLEFRKLFQNQIN